jgi:AcrR family transcriptional regulator
LRGRFPDGDLGENNMMEPRSPAQSVTEVRIIEAAAQLFARHGFKAATTREIAQLADINEATLFRYFLHKPDLFCAAVNSRLGRVKLGRELQLSLARDEDPAIVVPGIVTFLLNSLAQQPELYRLLHVAAFELPGADNVIREQLGPIFDAVSTYFQRRAEKGVIQKVAASLATLGILGTVSAHYHLHQLLSGCESPFASLEDEAAAYAELWLRALEQNTPKNTAPGLPVESVPVTSAS